MNTEQNVSKSKICVFKFISDPFCGLWFCFTLLLLFCGLITFIFSKIVCEYFNLLFDSTYLFYAFIPPVTLQLSWVLNTQQQYWVVYEIHVENVTNEGNSVMFTLSNPYMQTILQFPCFSLLHSKIKLILLLSLLCCHFKHTTCRFC